MNIRHKKTKKSLTCIFLSALMAAELITTTYAAGILHDTVENTVSAESISDNSTDVPDDSTPPEGETPSDGDAGILDDSGSDDPALGTADSANPAFGEENPDAADDKTVSDEDNKTPDGHETVPGENDVDTDESDDILSPETMKAGESILVSFYDVINGVSVPFTDPATGNKILSDIKLTCTDEGAYLCDSFTVSDNAYYSTMEPGAPRPWLRFMPVRRGYQVIQWMNQNSGNKYKPYNETSSTGLYDRDLSNLKNDVSYQAIYNTSPYLFRIQYHLDGGSLNKKEAESALPNYFDVTSSDIILPALEKSGYRFDGWYKDEAFSQSVSTIPTGTYIDSDAYGFVSDYHLYAKWTKISVPKVTISSAKYTKKGTIKVSYKKASGAQGYEVLLSTSKNFKKNTNTVDNAKKTSYTLSNLVKGKTYYFKVRAYIYDSKGNKIYGSYSKVKSCKVKDGVKEYDAKDATIKMSKVTISGGNTLLVQASASKRIKSSDDSYYLVRINSQTGKFENKSYNVVAALPKVKSLKYQIALTDDVKASLLQGCYAVAIKSSKGYTLVSNKSMLISNPEAAAGYTAAFPKTKTPSKKGLQGAGGDSNLGVQHFFFNLDLAAMLSNKKDPDATKYVYNGTTYYFNAKEFANTISIANAQGLVVTAQIGMSWPGSSKKYLIPSAARTEGHSYYSLDFKTTKARNELEAAFSYMAETFSQPNCHLDNWILGNEVNMHKDWYYAGNVSNTDFMKNYADTFRSLYYAVKGYSKNARVYICLDHNWAGTSSVWGAKPFMDSFNTTIKGMNKNIKWNLAYHLYPQNLNNAATWNDALATNKTTSPYVTPKNLEVLTNYVKKKFKKNTRIILTEQGFTSNGGTDVQAAGIAYTFYKAQFNDMVDAIIFHRYRDDPRELHAGTRQPLNYGICDINGMPKANSYNVFKFMDTPAYATYTNACLRTVGVSSWKKVNKNFDAKQLTTIP